MGLDEDFFLLGGTSIRAARLFVEIEDRWGIDRPMTLLAEYPTVASLARALAYEPDWHSLMSLETNGRRCPLFVVHDGTGSVFNARGLADELGPDQPIYGIRCEALNGVPLKARSLEELAATYVEQVRAARPNGPYVFYGVSLGGVIAMEMTRQLLLEGVSVPLVVLGDTSAPDVRRTAALAHARAGSRLRELRGMGVTVAAKRVAWLINRQLHFRLRRAGSVARAERRAERILDRAVARGGQIPVPARGRHVLRECGALLAPYHVRGPFPGRVLLLRSGGADEFPDRGWGDAVGERLSIVDVPGHHSDLGREASASYVAPVMKQALTAVRAATAQLDRT